MSSTLKTRGTQLAGLLLLAAWWLTSAGPAAARPLPPGDPTRLGSTTGGSTAPLPATPILVHDHPSIWAYLLVASIAVAVTLATVGAIGGIRRAAAGRQVRQLDPA